MWSLVEINPHLSLINNIERYHSIHNFDSREDVPMPDIEYLPINECEFNHIDPSIAMFFQGSDIEEQAHLLELMPHMNV